MVFVHARNSTVRTAMSLIEMAKNRGEASFFQPDQGADYGNCEKQVCNITHLTSVVNLMTMKVTVGLVHVCTFQQNKTFRWTKCQPQHPYPESKLYKVSCDSPLS